MIAGPCVLENSNIGYEIAAALKEITEELHIPFIFKASYSKANRTSQKGYRGPGLEEGLAQLQKIQKELDVPVISDIHCITELDAACEVLDVLQIPAFLCRQTFLIEAVAQTGKAVNIKKGQFLAPWDMKHVVEKVTAQGNHRVLVTERGAMFGYNNLVVDMRTFPVMSQMDCLVVFDGTHSTQLPGAGQGETSGQREMVPYLVKSSVAAGCDGLFMEVHPRPEESPSDRSSIYPLDQVRSLLKTALCLYEIVRSDKKE